MSDREPKEGISFSAHLVPQPDPEIAAKKHALAMMWHRWRDAIDFETLKKRHPEMAFEQRLDILFDAIGMLYGEYLTAHINQFRELEAQLVEQFKAERKGNDPGGGKTRRG